MQILLFLVFKLKHFYKIFVLAEIFQIIKTKCIGLISVIPFTDRL